MISNASSNTATAPPTGLSQSPFANPWFYALLSCFLLLIFLGIRLIFDSDLGFHLRGGQWMLQNHRFFTTDMYTYTVSDHPYLDIHWLYQIFLYLAYQVGGYSLLSILNIAFLIAVFFFTFRRLRLTNAPLWMCVILLGMALLSSEIRFRLRPENVSWLLMAITLWVLELRSFQNRNLLYLLPLIHLVWVNIEGLFAIGWALMTIYLVSSYIHNRKIDFQLLKYSALSVAACFINPNFLQGTVFPFTQFYMISTSNIFQQMVGEFQPTWTLASNDQIYFWPRLPLLTYKVFSIFLLVLILATFKRRKTHEILLSLSFFYLSTTSLRNIPLFLLASGPVAAAGWRDLEWGWLLKFQRSVLSRPAMAWTLTFCSLLFCLRLVTNAYYISDRREEHFGLGLDSKRQPVRATEYLTDNHLNGRILNLDQYGGWLDWKGPQKIFVDGRLEVMGEKFFSEYITSFNGNGALLRLAEKYNTEIIFFNPAMVPNWAADLWRAPDWRLIYLDDYTAIFLKKGYAPGTPALDRDHLLREWGIPLDIADSATSILQAPYPSAFQIWLQGFVQPQSYPEGLYTAATSFYSQSEKPLDSESFYLQGIQQSDGKYFEFYLDLSGVYYTAGEYEKSKLCVERVLKEIPTNTRAREILAHLP